jgi:hypothetical protein
MKEILSRLKSELKALANDIRTKKTQSACLMRENRNAGDIQNNLRSDRHHYRYRHIVYCLLRGRRLEEIETRVRPGNEIDKSHLIQLWARYTGLPYPERPQWPESAKEREVADAEVVCARSA